MKLLKDSWMLIAAGIVLFTVVGMALRFNSAERVRYSIDVESVEYSRPSAFSTPVTILHLKGGGTYLLDGLRSVPSGRVEISVTNGGDHRVVRNWNKK